MNIIFFSSGDFAVPTLEDLVKKDSIYALGINVKGIVTSNGKSKYYDTSIKEIAIKNNIPWCIPKDEDELYHFLQGFKDIDFYVVISYKKLSDRILDLVQWNAINIHASVLPFLRGAAPINWAIRNDFKQTGLTAFFLNGKIDCGDIINTTIVDIQENDTYKSLFLSLSNECSIFTLETLSFLPTYKPQRQVNIGVDSKLLKAPKITNKYWGNWLSQSQKEIDCLFRSTDEGLPIKLYAVNRDDEREYYEFEGKIWDFDFIPNFADGSEGVNWDLTECDGKNYIRLVFGNQVEKVISIKEIQLSGKKRLNIKEFLRGFKYSRLIDKFRIIITPIDYE